MRQPPTLPVPTSDRASLPGVMLRDLGVPSRDLGFVQHDLGAHPRPRHSGRVIYDAVLPQLLRQLPDDLIKAARIDGAGFWRIFYKIVLPLSPPILIVTVIWQFTGIWNEYLFGVVFTGGRQQPVTSALVGLATNSTNARSYDVASCAVLIAAIPPLLIYFFGGKYFVRGLTQGAIK
jgi:ABC-type maltose transport system permease subunit